VPWQRPLIYREKWSTSALKTLLLHGVKIAKIGPMNPEIIVLREIIKKEGKKLDMRSNV